MLHQVGHKQDGAFEYTEDDDVGIPSELGIVGRNLFAEFSGPVRDFLSRYQLRKRFVDSIPRWP